MLDVVEHVRGRFIQNIHGDQDTLVGQNADVVGPKAGVYNSLSRRAQDSVAGLPAEERQRLLASRDSDAGGADGVIVRDSAPSLGDDNILGTEVIVADASLVKVVEHIFVEGSHKDNAAGRGGAQKRSMVRTSPTAKHLDRVVDCSRDVHTVEP